MLPPDLFYNGIVLTGFITSLALGVGFVMNGTLLAAEAIAIFIMLTRYLETLGGMIGNATGLGATDYLAKCVESVMRALSLPVSANPVHAVSGTDIRFDSVSYAYSEGQTSALSNVSFQCPAGSTTALVGSSGSGKTTVTRLIARFFDVNSGNVRVGGIDVRDYDHAALLNEIAIVFQDVYLFDTTIEENLRLARPNATAEEMDAAARAARLDEIVGRLPNGWQTIVGEGGAQLSGGERQRVSIARAFLKNSRIVLIDEAVSALDPENERAISDAIAELAKGTERTIVIIAHRPSTLAAADWVVALDGGRVVEVGAPGELLRSGGIFAGLYKQYERAGGWRIGKDR
jgi:ATP-binding cassette subfamily B protein